jgi:predicted kinase
MKNCNKGKSCGATCIPGDRKCAKELPGKAGSALEELGELVHKGKKQQKRRAFVMVGSPGSGKSTQASKLARDYNAVIVSGDSIREKLYGDASIQGQWPEIEREMRRQIKEAGERGESIIVDNTHVKASLRKRTQKLLRDSGYDSIDAIVVNPPLEVSLSRNAQRSRRVPEEVIRGMHERLRSSLGNIDKEGFESVVYIGS